MVIIFLRVHDDSYHWKDGNVGRTCVSGIEVGSKLMHLKKMDIPVGFTWQTVKNRGSNSMHYIGKKGDSYEVRVAKGTKQFGFIEAKYESMQQFIKMGEKWQQLVRT